MSKTSIETEAWNNCILTGKIGFAEFTEKTILRQLSLQIQQPSSFIETQLNT